MDAEVFSQDARFGSRTARARPRMPAVLGAAAIHAAVLAVLGLAFQTRLLPARTEFAIEVVPTAAPTPVTQLLAAATLPPPMATVMATIDPVPALTQRSTVARVIPSAVLGGLRTTAVTARPTTLRPAGLIAGPPSPAPVRPSDDQRDLAGWEAKIRQAVQEAAVYPEQARLLHREGSAQVSFDYDSGTVAEAAIVQSSHIGALDRAALAAVARAAIPRPPDDVGPRKRRMLVWVAFRLE